MAAKIETKPLLQAAAGQRPSRYPVWFMRQAGRYLPEYRQVRATTDFTKMCQTPELASEVTLQPLRRYDLDAAIIFSDILIPAVGMGQNLTLDKGEGPNLSNPVRSYEDFKRLKTPQAGRDLGYVGEAISKTKSHMRPEQTMIGFAGAPFTVASYMIEGSGSKTFTEVKKLLFNDYQTFSALIEHIAMVTVDYLKMQVEAGADIVMLFDTWAGHLSAPDYRRAVFPMTKFVLSEMKKQGVPVIYFPGQGLDRMFELEGLDVDVISVDWRTRLANAAATLKSIGLNPTLQGNLDPQLLVATEGEIRARVREIVEEAQACARAHIFNVGHGLLPHTPPESLTWVIDELRKM